MEKFAAFLGLIFFLLIAFALSENRKKINWRIVGWGLALQVVFALLVLGIPALGIPGPFRFFFDAVNSFFINILSYSDAGAAFVFGPLMDDKKMGGFVFATRVLPTIIFFSALVAILYYLKILQKVVYGLAWIMKKFMPISGPESLSTAGNIFLGQTESPLLIKPFLLNMSRSELLCVMIGGMANVAGGVMAAYVAMLQSRFPDIAGHLLTVSIMSAPATILISKMILPETEKIFSKERLKLDVEKLDANVVEAATRGTSEGLVLALNVAAMLLAFTALVYLFNGIFGYAIGQLGYELSLQQILGFLFSPIAWLLGTPASEIFQVGHLLGEKVILNEFVAYLSLSNLTETLSDRSILIASYALCGFANIASIGIQVGGIGALVPERRGDLARLGVKALIGGNLATFVSTVIVSLMV